MTWHNWLLIGVLAVVGAALIWIVVLALTRATRLNRLNVRVDLARAALISALDRRAVVGRTIAATCPDEAVSAELIAVADEAEQSGFADREGPENRLSTVIAQSDPASRPHALTAELADAQARVTIARRFYNDAVRDARTLGERRMVRWFKLGGHSRLPDYFEITERVSAR
ncbi:MAG: NUDIX hydrolase [Gordonia sp. (in: high G+C Gram-positive bacteria)]